MGRGKIEGWRKRGVKGERLQEVAGWLEEQRRVENRGPGERRSKREKRGNSSRCETQEDDPVSVPAWITASYLSYFHPSVFFFLSLSHSSLSLLIKSYRTVFVL